jgi:hypothetical protein
MTVTPVTSGPDEAAAAPTRAPGSDEVDRAAETADALSADRLGGRRRPKMTPRVLRASLLDHADRVILLVAGVAFWVYSLDSIPTAGLEDYGLPPALPLAWYAGLSLLLVGAVLTLCSARPSPPLLALFTAAIVLVLYGTVPLITSVPHYNWVYKHIGVVQLIDAQGALEPNTDIYNRWPGFFAMSALFSALAGEENPVAYAGWAEVFFVVVDVALVVAIARTLTRDTRLAWAAALVYVTANWVGQSYFSPQAFDVTIVLTVLFLAIRFLPGSGKPGSIPAAGSLLRRLRLLPFLPAKTTPIQPASRRTRALVVGLILVLDAAAVISHQLSPYMLLFGLALLWCFRVIEPWWLVAAAGAITFGFLVLNLGYVNHHFDLFASLDPFQNVKPPTTTAPDPLPGKQFHARTATALSGLVWLLTAVGLARQLRRRNPAAVPVALLAFAPTVMIVMQNYGGEAILRIFLFSLPFASPAVVWAIAPANGVWRLRRAPLVLLTVGALTALFIPSFLGQEETNIIPADEVAGAEYFYQHAEPGSRVYMFGGNAPFRAAANYSRFNDGDDPLQHPYACAPRPDRAIVRVITAIPEPAERNYLVFTTSGTTLAHVLGYCQPEEVARIEHALATSYKLELWYKTENIRIYELLG